MGGAEPGRDEEAVIIGKIGVKDDQIGADDAHQAVQSRPRGYGKRSHAGQGEMAADVHGVVGIRIGDNDLHHLLVAAPFTAFHHGAWIVVQVMSRMVEFRPDGLLYHLLSPWRLPPRGTLDQSHG